MKKRPKLKSGSGWSGGRRGRRITAVFTAELMGSGDGPVDPIAEPRGTNLDTLQAAGARKVVAGLQQQGRVGRQRLADRIDKRVLAPGRRQNDRWIRHGRLLVRLGVVRGARPALRERRAIVPVHSADTVFCWPAQRNHVRDR